MAECEIATCGISCPGACYCMDAGIGGCECWCDGDHFTKPRGIEGILSADMMVEFSATDMPLGRLAVWFDFLFPGQILVPASKMNKQITTGKMGKMKIGDVVETLGLVAIKKPLVGRDFTNSNFG